MFLQEQDVYERQYLGKRMKAECSAISVSSKVLYVYPDEKTSFSIHVSGTSNRIVELLVKGPSKNIATIYVNPRIGKTPFTSTATILVSPTAPPGNYLIEVTAYDTDNALSLGKEKVSLIILKKEIPSILIKHHDKMTKIFNKYGSNALIWYILKYIYPKGASFKQIKSIYEQIVGKNISKGTIGNILNRMIKKRIIKRENGLYKLVVTKPQILITRIDASRIHIPRTRKSNRRRALRIKKKHGLLPAICFLVYTLAGVRDTGFLLFWYYQWFIYCEQKTHFCHRPIL